ncbi:Uncharacterised protein [Vibrio cholerae]|nr:Uncharacterised protein [Vibrio cholerae]
MQRLCRFLFHARSHRSRYRCNFRFATCNESNIWLFLVTDTGCHDSYADFVCHIRV